jgi:signal transduction histidine kinase
MSDAASIAALGWTLALAAAAMLLAARRAADRRGAAIEGALHELRRPLQELALGAGPGPAANGDRPAALELAVCALGDLERAIDGETAPPRRRLVRLRPLVEGSVARWVAASGLDAASLSLDWRAGPAAVVADPRRIVQALDNLLVNAIEHGSPPVRIEVATCGRGVRVAVEDAGASARPFTASRNGRSGRPPRGLGIVAGIAAEHGGIFAIRDAGGATRAVLELPLASLPLPAIAHAGAA